jgi:ankyrin repeat protein
LCYGNEAIEQSLIEYEADGSAINKRFFDVVPLDEGGSVKIFGTPLSFAALYGNVDVVRLLLKIGAKPEIRNDTGRTPLSWAAMKGQRDIVEI